MIEVKSELIGKELIQAVMAKELYLDLGLSKPHWSSWYEKNIISNEFFIEGRDWMGFTLDVNGNESKDFAITLDFAKHIAMMAKTAKSHEYRNFLIDCEKKAHDSNRHIDAIRALLLLDAPSTWEKLYPDSFFIAIMNLHGHYFDGNKSTPSYCGRIIRAWIYDIVLPEQLNFEIDTKRGLEKKHQWFQNENGRQTLLVQIGKVEMIARMSESRADFEANCARAFLSSPLQLSIKS